MKLKEKTVEMILSLLLCKLEPEKPLPDIRNVCLSENNRSSNADNLSLLMLYPSNEIIRLHNQQQLNKQIKAIVTQRKT